MITEKMVELLLLHTTLSNIPSKFYNKESVTSDEGVTINVKKLYNRFLELQDEFIQPYVIDKPSKEV